MSIRLGWGSWERRRKGCVLMLEATAVPTGPGSLWTGVGMAQQQQAHRALLPRLYATSPCPASRLRHSQLLATVLAAASGLGAVV